ncbi:arginase family protein [Asanoa hainanensis]|nr:arginase family protein [Asanoa hainanensis]
MDERWGLLGVPSSAGAHTPGLEKGPAALRAAGLASLLAGGVLDHGDVPGFRWRADLSRPTAKNVDAVARVASDTAAGVERILAAGQLPFVIGGDCSITVGVVAGFARAGVGPALLYVDGGPDLYTPLTRVNGNLDSMGLAHLLAIPGHVPAVAGVGPVVPLLAVSDVVCYGHSLPAVDHERGLLDRLGITHVHADDVRADPVRAASRARAAIESAGPRFVVHCDVDVLSFNDTPLADVPDSGDEPIGLRLTELAASLSVFASSPRFAGFVLTEVNPDHAPEPDLLPRFSATLAKSLSGSEVSPAR